MTLVNKAMVLLIMTLAMYFSTSKSDDFVPKIDYPFKIYSGGVVTNGHECARIGSSILEKGGSAVDAAIAALFCEGVASPHLSGLGGGLIMTIYTKDDRTTFIMDARETAPLNAKENMLSKYNLSSKGLATAVPGELSGMWEAHRYYGELPWSELVKPTIDLCYKGHLVTEELANVLEISEHVIRRDRGLTNIYLDPDTNKPYVENNRIKRPVLARTLERIAQNGPGVIYDGMLTNEFVNDIQNAGGIITTEDIKQYKPVWKDPVTASLINDYTLYTSPLPSSGIMLTYILNILSNYLNISATLESITNWQRIVESFKFGYARHAEFGDPMFAHGLERLVKNLTSSAYAERTRKRIIDNKTFEDPLHYGPDVQKIKGNGTSHIVVLAPNGDAVSVTTTINQYFGAGFVSQSTGIILNNQMVDFTYPVKRKKKSKTKYPNKIEPGKRPVSSMCPTIVVDNKGDVFLIIGSSGGPRIISTVALVIIRHVWFRQLLGASIAASRLHHQLTPMKISVEQAFDEVVLKGLHEIGHKYQIEPDFGNVLAIGTKYGVEGSYDTRHSGQVSLMKKINKRSRGTELQSNQKLYAMLAALTIILINPEHCLFISGL